jgi:glycosyltransferase involved in cell wall biosynthesis
MPFFSVIMPAYNRSTLISATLDSVCAQTFTDWEIVIVDDGSTDSTYEVISEYAARNPDRITTLRQPNSGPGAARNFAIQKIAGEYAVFLDSDDLWFPWTLATFRRAIDQYAKPSLVVGALMQFNDVSDVKKVTEGSFEPELFPDLYSALAVKPIYTGEIAVRTDALRSAGGYTNLRINAEDSDLWLKLGCMPGFVHIKSPIIFGYRRHPDSAVADYTKTYLGMVHLIGQERTGNYPGGESRKIDRLRIIAEHVRVASIACLKRGEFKRAFFLYKSTFGWQLRLFRFRYLTAFPFLAARYAIKSL